MTAASGPAAASATPGLWRLSAGLAVGHVVLMITGVLLQQTPSLTEGKDGIIRSFTNGDMTRILTGGYVELLAFVMLVPVVVFLAREVGHRTDQGRWASTSAGAFGIGYVAMTVGAGFAPGAAALWGAHSGLDPTTALAVNDVRNVAYLLGLALLGAHALGLGAAALFDGWATRSVGWGGVATGTVMLGSVPFAAAGLADVSSLVWIVWWLALAVQMVRATPIELTAIGDPLAAAPQR